MYFCRTFLPVTASYSSSLNFTSLALQERLVLQIRRGKFFYMDLERDESGMYKDSYGNIVDDTLINWRAGNPHYGQETCIIVGGNPLSYMDWTCVGGPRTSDYVTLCLM